MRYLLRFILFCDMFYIHWQLAERIYGINKYDDDDDDTLTWINPFAPYLNALLVAFMRPQLVIWCKWVNNCKDFNKKKNTLH
jgi:hypothetical protein